MDEDEERPLPAHLQQHKSRVICGVEGPRYTESYEYAGTFSSMHHDDAFSLEGFKDELEVRMLTRTDELVRFEMRGIDAALANAFRRILIAEVPTMALHTIQVYQNTGVLCDEVLVHRLGLIPIRLDPQHFEYRRENEEHSAENSVKFKLHVKCDQGVRSVYSRDFVYEPLSDLQRQKFPPPQPSRHTPAAAAAASAASAAGATDEQAVELYDGEVYPPPAPVYPDILITKLGAGQEIELEAYCEKGVGKDHAKWSPVATAVYRLFPELVFPKGPLVDAEAQELKDLCPMNCFDIEDTPTGVESVVTNVRQCTTCRVCMERFPGRVQVNKIKNHFIFNIESTGCIPADQLFERAVDVLRHKCAETFDMLKANCPDAFSDEDEAAQGSAADEG
ncbi:unnamed protein product [Vitrella brassicaformis CCMP3155]|uniref:DNA-directed RNA polymerase RpoA/D/Rpb3-type domain-containing protein n=2 Tax=Vitrella brassicaformis TaxID=1169539 RepID=A0A0G4H0L4_VITBC|nr:unnamed protein product [Vitrella brassicaformis CCMP3155]|mmetsp:Transcript_45209/g.112305  ORF Transcript_45209/g.112305 Transcript_45209/m.112305 type:complete len:392 (-) Transcript_45209:77-1252(-)|eukprot:CEM36954.1 unnamed protein product [Vitrella brassicaformis CCMP3155]